MTPTKPAPRDEELTDLLLDLIPANDDQVRAVVRHVIGSRDEFVKALALELIRQHYASRPTREELLASPAVPEYEIPRLIDPNLPKSTYDALKRISAPKTFGLGKRNFSTPEDIKQWVIEIRDHWKPRPPKRKKAAYRIKAAG